MKTKLTLSISKSAIEKVKVYASQNKTSVSQTVEEMIDALQIKRKPSHDKLFGCLEDTELSSMTDDQLKELRLNEKFGV